MKKYSLIIAAITILPMIGCIRNHRMSDCKENKCITKTDTTMEIKNEKELLTCTLTNVEMKERLKIIEKFKSLIKEKKEVENGMIFQFEGSNKNLNEIINLISLERQCCAFLTFDLKIQKESNPIELTISGKEGTKEFLKLELGL